MTLRPAQPDSGIIFRRVDLPQPVSISAFALLVGDTRLCSCLEIENPDGSGDIVKVGTVEHILSALAGLGIDNAWIDLDAPEVPILDGSAAPFVFLIQSAGIEEQHALKKFIRIKESIEVKEADKWARLDPYHGFSMEFSIAFAHPAINNSAQSARVDFAHQSYLREIARARTFGFMQEVEWMRENGLALGGGLGNAIVLDEYRVLNNDGLRYSDEFVRHKLLDALGDLYLLGHPILGAFVAHKSGHALNNKLARALLQMQDRWEYVTFTDAQSCPTGFQNWLSAPQPQLA